MLHPTKHSRHVAWALLVAILFVSALTAVQPARANVTDLALFRRTCGTIDAWLIYDGFSEGRPAFKAVFAVDLNGDGVFGQVGEPTRSVIVTPTGGRQLVGAQLFFPAVPEGTTISVTAYEVDSAGVPVSPQVAPVSYQCAHKPAKDKLPSNSPINLPPIGIVARVRVKALIVYAAPSALSPQLGGLGRGAMLNVVAMNQRGDWIEFEYAGRMGWVMWPTQVFLSGPFSQLPRVANVDPYTPSPIAPSETPTP